LHTRNNLVSSHGDLLQDQGDKLVFYIIHCKGFASSVRSEYYFMSQFDMEINLDEGTIKTPNPKCHLYWCLIEFIDWRYSQACWYFRPLYLLSDLPLPYPPCPFPK
jgi:hypothetical protein